MRNLLHMVGLDHHYVRYREGDLPELEKDVIDYGNVEKLLDKHRTDSKTYIDKVLNGKKKPRKGDYFKTGDKFNCYGCSLCHDICPVQAIQMKMDEEGFIYPQIDRETCISCGLCEKKCIHNEVKKINQNQKCILPIIRMTRCGVCHRPGECLAHSVNIFWIREDTWQA